MFLVAAVAAAFVGQARVGRTLARLDPDRTVILEPTVAGRIAPWLVVAGLGLIGVAVLLA
jgi:hypothetical protein